MQQNPERGITRISFSNLDTGPVDRVVVEGKNPIELKKVDGVWVLADGKRANQRSVERLLEALPNIQSSDLTTREEKRFAEFEVDEEKGSHVVAYAGSEVLVDFWVGKSASGGS